MSDAKRLSGLVGPTLAAMVAAEFPLVQPDLYARQIPPVVYLSGVLMFVGGLALVRAHNVWKRDWTVLLTLTGWLALVLGLVRMFAASRYQTSAANVSTTSYMVLEGVLFALGLFLSFKAYGPSRESG